MVAAQMQLIQAVQQDDWWEHVTLPMLENLRKRLRDLVKFIDKARRVIVVMDFEYQIGRQTEVGIKSLTAAVDVVQYRKRVMHFLQPGETDPRHPQFDQPECGRDSPFSMSSSKALLDHSTNEGYDRTPIATVLLTGGSPRTENPRVSHQNGVRAAAPVSLTALYPSALRTQRTARPIVNPRQQRPKTREPREHGSPGFPVNWAG